MNLTDHPDMASYEIGKLPLVAWLLLVGYAVVTFFAGEEPTVAGILMASGKSGLYLVSSAGVLVVLEYIRTAILFPKPDNADKTEAGS